MRTHVDLAIITLAVVLAGNGAGRSQEVILKLPTLLPEKAPNAVRPAVPPKVDAEKLRQELLQLKAARQALPVERKAAEAAVLANKPSAAEERARLRLRLGEVLGRLTGAVTQEPRQVPESKSKPAETVRPPGSIPPKGEATSAEKVGPLLPTKNEQGVIAPEALADSYFRLGKYDKALESYQLLDLLGMRAEERLAVRYMMATCMRKLGKWNEAKIIYREIANSKGDVMLAECARWQLSNISWRQETETQILDLRQRLKTLEKSP